MSVYVQILTLFDRYLGLLYQIYKQLAKKNQYAKLRHRVLVILPLKDIAYFIHRNKNTQIRQRAKFFCAMHNCRE